jgi:hypothetical protein
MPDTPNPSPEDIEDLKDKADALEERVQEDGVISDEDDASSEGVGPHTAVVP